MKKMLDARCQMPVKNISRVHLHTPRSLNLLRRSLSRFLLCLILSPVSCLLSSFPLVFCLLSSVPAFAQTIVDKMVVTINGELITYSDLVWQLALQPDTPLVNASSEDLNRALATVIDQRLVAQEAEKLPSIAPSDKEVDEQLNKLIQQFSSPTVFYSRAESVGLSAEQVREIVRRRVRIEKYLDFRFRTFTIVLPQEVADYYQSVFAPRFRQTYPGRILPTLEQSQKQIEEELTNSKIASDIDRFLEDARTRAEIVTLNVV